MVYEPAALADPVEAYERILRNFPCKELVLHDAASSRVYDRIILHMLEDHADYRELRYEGMYLILDRLELEPLHYVFVKSRSVKVIDGADRILAVAVGKGARIYGEVTALGVTSDDERSFLKSCPCCFEILKSRELPRDREFKSHIKVFFPADECYIRTSVCNIVISFLIELEYHRRELRLTLEIDVVYISAHLHVLKSLGRSHHLDEPRVVLGG